MDITPMTTWTIRKDGQSVALALDDIHHLLDHLIRAGEVIVIDEATGRCGDTTDQIEVSLNSGAIRILLRKENSGSTRELAQDGLEMADRCNREAVYEKTITLTN